MILILIAVPAWAGVREADESLVVAKQYFRQGLYFKAARYAFSAANHSSARKPEAYAWATAGLAEAGLYNSAGYFFIRTLQSKNRPAIRRALEYTEVLIVHLGLDLLRNYLIRHTKPSDYNSQNRSAMQYAMGKYAVLRGKFSKAIEHLSTVSRSSTLWPFAMQIRGTAYAVGGASKEALRDFRACVSGAGAVTERVGKLPQTVAASFKQQKAREAEDLQARCQAGVARTLYQMRRFKESDWTYDQIPKKSFVWTDILFEQAWASFAIKEYNRTLGKLVAYKSPALQFVFNPEVDVLRAQSYLVLCLYADANQAINEFKTRYRGVGLNVKRFIQRNEQSLSKFYFRGKKALRRSLYTRDKFDQLLNRFVRGPYFQNLVSAERRVQAERIAVKRFDAAQKGVAHNMRQGFPGFLMQTLKWRERSIRLFGGAFVKNSLLDFYQVVINEFEKIAFIKLEMLSRAKQKLLRLSKTNKSRSRGVVEPSRRDDQLYWSFNGEFWNDELGDYVFGLKSECGSS